MPRPNRAKISVLLTILICSAVAAQSVRLTDESDWWSVNNEKYNRPDGPIGSSELGAANFEIAGVSVKDGFEKIVAKLGRTALVERGDASYGRTQACYVSSNPANTVHLVYEGAEGEEAYFYLFEGGPAWKGSDLCAKSNLVSPQLRTSSGLRLGLTRVQVEAILGKPDSVAGNRVFYDRDVRQKTTAQQFEMLRKSYPMQLTDAEAHKQFDSVEIPESVEVHFSGSRSIYLAISKSVADLE